MQQSVFGVKKEMDIESRIKAVQDAWDSSNPDCRFKVRLCFWEVLDMRADLRNVVLFL